MFPRTSEPVEGVPAHRKRPRQRCGDRSAHRRSRHGRSWQAGRAPDPVTIELPLPAAPLYRVCCFASGRRKDWGGEGMLIGHPRPFSGSQASLIRIFFLRAGLLIEIDRSI